MATTGRTCPRNPAKGVSSREPKLRQGPPEQASEMARELGVFLLSWAAIPFRRQELPPGYFDYPSRAYAIQGGTAWPRGPGRLRNSRCYKRSVAVSQQARRTAP